MKFSAFAIGAFLLGLPFARAQMGPQVEFKGLVESLPPGMGAGTWTVAGRTVTVTAATEIETDDGPIAIGACVEVEGTPLPGGGVQAREISTDDDCGPAGPMSPDEISFKGLIEELPPGMGVGTWTVAGRTVTVTAATEIETDDGPIAIGACVEVEGTPLPGGGVQAREINTDDDCGVPTSGMRLRDRARFKDRVNSLPAGGTVGEWTIGGRVVRVEAATRLRADDGPFEPGACVDVKLVLGGQFPLAQEIRTERSEKCEDRDRGELEFFGVVLALPPDGLVGEWRVNGSVVLVSDSTEIEYRRGPVQIGSCVEIEGDPLGDDRIAAREIEVKTSFSGCADGDLPRAEVRFRGLIAALPEGGTAGEWTVSGRPVLVGPATSLAFDDAPRALGECVRVEGVLDEDGVVQAREIEGRRRVECGVGGPGGGALFEITGLLDALPAGADRRGAWTINGIAVEVALGTELNAENGPFDLGACVKAQGSVLDEGVRLAREVETKPSSDCAAASAAEIEFQGVVESAPAPGSTEWTIAGLTVTAEAMTEVDERLGPLMIGACVKVEGRPEGALRVVAREIRVLSGAGLCASEAGVVSGAAMRSGPVSPGEILSIFGPGVGPADDRGLEIVDDRVTRGLGATRVFFDDEAAPLLFASGGQINVVAPISLEGKAETRLRIESEGGWSRMIVLPVEAANPGVFTLNSEGVGQAAALQVDDDGSVTINGPQNPVALGGVLSLFVTGLGRAPIGEDGQVFGPSVEGLPLFLFDVEVEIGGVPAEVRYAGVAPGLVYGVWQINVQAPPTAEPGAETPLTLRVGGRSSRVGVTVALR